MQSTGAGRQMAAGWHVYVRPGDAHPIEVGVVGRVVPKTHQRVPAGAAGPAR